VCIRTVGRENSIVVVCFPPTYTCVHACDRDAFHFNLLPEEAKRREGQEGEEEEADEVAESESEDGEQPRAHDSGPQGAGDERCG
jgi:hypothetical protein